MTDDRHPQHQRVKAARALGGFGSVDALAAEIAKSGPGLGAKTLRKIEAPRDPRIATGHELNRIAEATGVSPAFFAMDLAVAPVTDPERDTLDKIGRVLLGVLSRPEGRKLLREIDGKEVAIDREPAAVKTAENERIWFEAEPGPELIRIRVPALAEVRRQLEKLEPAHPTADLAALDRERDRLELEDLAAENRPEDDVARGRG